MKNENNCKEEEYIERDEIPDDTIILQCGRVVGDDGVLGRIEPRDSEELLQEDR